MSNNSSCSQNIGRFFDHLLLIVRRFQKVARRLLSLPGFSAFVECDTFLPKYFQFMVGHASKMSCPRAYRSSVSECKTWALRSCVGFSVEERQWLMDKKRLPRSNWMCHAGVFGLFRAIYKGTGHKCEPNHVENLKGTLKVLARGLAVSQLLTRVVNGKVVYLFKVTDQMNSKLDVLAQDLKIVDSTFSFWQKQLKNFAKSVRCHGDLTMEFLCKYTAEINRAFVALLRLFEIQDALSQVSQLNEKTLIGYSDLPKFVSSHLSAKLTIDPSLKLTVTALEEGLSVLASPMIDIEHEGDGLIVNILMLAPEIKDLNSFCVLEHLTPLKFNLSGKCFTGPVQHTNLALITCPNSKQIVSVEALDRCFSSEIGFLCPKNVLRTVTSLQWLGFAWNPDLKLSFPRNHVPAQNCEHIHPLVHLGGRYFLSTTTGTITLNSGELNISPRAVYNFPCNVSFVGMKASLATYPQRLMVSFPLFSSSTVTYVQWDPKSNDLSALHLHHKSLTIPPPIKINRTVINDFDELFQRYDNQLSSTLKKADSMIEQIEETTESSYVAYIAFAALTLSVVNLIVFCVVCRCVFRSFSRHSIQKLPPPLPAPASPVCHHEICGHCSKPVRKNRRKKTT